MMAISEFLCQRLLVPMELWRDSWTRPKHIQRKQIASRREESAVRLKGQKPWPRYRPCINLAHHWLNKGLIRKGPALPPILFFSSEVLPASTGLSWWVMIPERGKGEKPPTPLMPPNYSQVRHYLRIPIVELASSGSLLFHRIMQGLV